MKIQKLRKIGALLSATIITGIAGSVFILNPQKPVQAGLWGQRIQINAQKVPNGGKVSRIEGCNQDQDWKIKPVSTTNTIYTDSWYWQTCTSGARVQVYFTDGSKCRVHVPQVSTTDPYPVRYGTTSSDNCKPF